MMNSQEPRSIPMKALCTTVAFLASVTAADAQGIYMLNGRATLGNCRCRRRGVSGDPNSVLSWRTVPGLSRAAAALAARPRRPVRAVHPGTAARVLRASRAALVRADLRTAAELPSRAGTAAAGSAG